LDIKKFKLPTINLPDNNISDIVKPSSTTAESNQVVEKQNYTTMFESFAKVLVKKPIPITIAAINSSVLNEIKLHSRKEELLDKSSLYGQRPTNNIIHNRNFTDNSNIGSNQESKKSGIFATILKWGALIGGAIFA